MQGSLSSKGFDEQFHRGIQVTTLVSLLPCIKHIQRLNFVLASFVQTCKRQSGIQSSLLLDEILDGVLVNLENFKHVVEASDVVTVS